MDSTSYSIVTQGSFGSNPGPDSLEQAACPESRPRRLKSNTRSCCLEQAGWPGAEPKQALKAKGKQTYTQLTWR